VAKYGDRIAVGIDARNGIVEQNGWTESSNVNYLELAEKMEDFGVKHIIFTDISRDGTETGPNLDMLDKLNRGVSCRIIASGGIANIKDIANLKDLGLYAAISGKALYTGMLDLGSAVKLCGA
ncbi:MAG TPA: 1-(5-phosphoribosyl)-5-((5-phosphoribosylamino)methylideneamino)imidazole-4-carboxamide isomerase, partial [Ruminococcaceae bacterium]|nr:1-(5-phosphoribosyl)-5-((5-phosphoribosylamino)methylideneamino)imidazole-4-carboxamide isomerase [Oscillospiraceae bacterium]